MRVFVSFASEQTEEAEAIALALRNRGYAVFFSQDDLPPGESFDARLESAIAASDLFLFVISAESIAKGRYTLTELAFARDKWPNPSGRVLPVMLTPVAMDKVPRYLKSVTILEPEGNAAAEVSAAVDRMLRKVKGPARGVEPKSLGLFAGLGIASGLLSYLTFQFAPVLKFTFLFPATSEGRTTVLPGLIFGCTLAACNYLSGARDRLHIVLVVLLVAAGWVVAYDTAAYTGGTLSEYRVDRPDVPDAPTADTNQTPGEAFQRGSKDFPFAYAIAGLVGGAVGGLAVIVALTMTNIRFRRPDWCFLTWAAATLLGSILGLGNVLGQAALVILFVAWQTALLLLFKLGLERTATATAAEEVALTG